MDGAGHFDDDDESEAEIDRLLKSLGLELPSVDDEDDDATALSLEEGDEQAERGGWIGRCPRYDEEEDE